MKLRDLYHFDPNDPVPLVSVSEYQYAEAKLHAAALDLHLGLAIAETETLIAGKAASAFEKKEKWVGLDPQTLQTPYLEIRMLLEEVLALSPEDKTPRTIVDLGAGYGRMAYVIGRCFPHLNFAGYEIAEERVEEGSKAIESFPNVSLLRADVAAPDFHLPRAEIYFLYDFGTLPSIQAALVKLREAASARSIIVVGRGRAVRDEIERHEAWLSRVIPPRHYPAFSVYQSA